MLMMCAGLGRRAKGSAADAHDAHRLGAEGQRAARLMLMMCASPGRRAKGSAADADDVRGLGRLMLLTQSLGAR